MSKFIPTCALSCVLLAAGAFALPASAHNPDKDKMKSTVMKDGMKGGKMKDGMKSTAMKDGKMKDGMKK